MGQASQPDSMPRFTPRSWLVHVYRCLPICDSFHARPYPPVYPPVCHCLPPRGPCATACRYAASSAFVHTRNAAPRLHCRVPLLAAPRPVCHYLPLRGKQCTCAHNKHAVPASEPACRYAVGSVLRISTGCARPRQALGFQQSARQPYSSRIVHGQDSVLTSPRSIALIPTRCPMGDSVFPVHCSPRRPASPLSIGLSFPRVRAGQEDRRHAAHRPLAVIRLAIPWPLNPLVA